MTDPAHCERCGADRVVRVPGKLMAYGGGNVIQVGRTTLRGSIVPVTRYVCCACGAVEQRVDDPADLERLWERFADQP